MEISIAAVTLVAGSLAATAGAIVAGRRGQRRRSRWSFLALCAVGTIWGLSYTAVRLVDDPALSLFALRFVWVGFVLFAPLWFLFVAGYAAEDRWFSPRGLATLFAIPAVVLVAGASTGPRLFLAESGATVASGYDVLAADSGPLFVAYVAYAVWMLGVSAGRLVAIEWSGTNRRANLALLAATLGAIAAVLTPAMLTATNALLLLAVTTYGLFDPEAIARHRLFDETSDPVLATGVGDRVTTANAAARAMFGEDIVGDRLSDHPVGDGSLTDLATGARRRTSVSISPGDEPRHVEVTATPLGGDANTGRLLLFRDVTEQRRLSSAFGRVVDVTSDIVTVVANDDIAYASPTAAEAFGYSPSALSGEPFRSLVHPEDLEAVEAALEEASASDEPVRASYRFQHRDEGWRTVESTVVDLRDDPTVSGYVLTTRDVTKQRKREQRLRVLNRTLRHDLRNDMNVVLGYIDRYVEGDGDLTDLQRARDRARDLFELGERAREMDRVLERGDEESVELRSIVTDRAETLRERYPAVTLFVDADVDRRIARDSEIDLALRHLLENAVDHHDRQDATIWIDVVPAGAGSVRISVADDGPGIPDSELSVLRRGTETPLEHGSGLGLWLVQWLVETAGGEVVFEEPASRGTVVTLELPTVGGGPETNGESDRDAPSTAQSPADHPWPPSGLDASPSSDGAGWDGGS